MDRRQLLTLAAALAVNALLWAWGWPRLPPVPADVLKERIARLTGEIDRARVAAAWTTRVRAALADPPAASAEAMLTRIQTLAQSHDWSVTETSRHGDRPARLVIAGSGSYRGFAALLTALRCDHAVLVERLLLTALEPGRLRARIEAVVRAGPWEGPPNPGGRPDPALPVDSGTGPLGMTDLFGRGESPSPTPGPIRPAIMYTGYFLEAGTPTIMLLEANRPAVLQAGETTPGGIVVASATPDRLTVRNQRGESWTIDMQTAP